MQFSSLNFNAHYIAHQLGVLDVSIVQKLDIEEYLEWQEYFSILNGTKKEEKPKRAENDDALKAFFKSKMKG